MPSDSWPRSTDPARRRQAEEEGDPFLLPFEFDATSTEEVRRLFGGEFADGAADARPRALARSHPVGLRRAPRDRPRGGCPGACRRSARFATLCAGNGWRRPGATRTRRSTSASAVDTRLPSSVRAAPPWTPRERPDREAGAVEGSRAPAAHHAGCSPWSPGADRRARAHGGGRRRWASRGAGPPDLRARPRARHGGGRTVGRAARDPRPVAAAGDLPGGHGDGRRPGDRGGADAGRRGGASPCPRSRSAPWWRPPPARGWPSPPCSSGPSPSSTAMRTARSCRARSPRSPTARGS